MAENYINKERESKNNLERLRKLIANPRKYTPIFLNKVAPLIKDDETYLKLKWRLKFGEPLNLDSPRTFNEKLQWLKLHDRRPEYTRMVDKYEAKKYVAEKIGEEYIIPTLGVWDHFDDIDFDSLPNQFVLKCTHDSGGLVICKDKSALDMEATRKKLEKCLKRNYYMQNREWPYKDVKRRIIAEKYMEDAKTKELRDYKFYCFGGVAKCFKVDFNRFVEHHANYFDMERKVLFFGKEGYSPKHDKVIDLPPTLNEMVSLAEQLTKGTSFLRADFYDVEGKVYFGELTFFPASGMGRFSPEDGDKWMGQWLRLPDTEGGGRIALFSRDFICVLTYHNEYIDEGLKDYKIFNFDGKTTVIQVDYNRFVGYMRNLYTTNWEYIEAKINYPNNPNYKIAKPEKLEEMIELAGRLSKDFPFLRTDFYSIEGKLYFGELTFFPEAGLFNFDPESYGVELDNYIKLPWGGVILKGEGYALLIYGKLHKDDLPDYKVFVFNGEPRLIEVDYNRFVAHKLNVYDLEWNYMDCYFTSHNNPNVVIPRPERLKEMLSLARTLSQGIDFLRVDFYSMNGRLLLGELTFSPGSGFIDIHPEEMDLEMGSWLKLTNLKQ